MKLRAVARALRVEVAMARVLVPFTDPGGAQRAVAQLLAEPRDPLLSVHLLAAVEPLRPGKVRMFVTEEEASSQVRAAAQRWLAPLEAALEGARIPYTAEIVIGTPRDAIQAATTRSAFDRVLLPTARGRGDSTLKRLHPSEVLHFR